MVQINQKWDKLLELFYEQPDKAFTIRELAKQTGIPKTSVQRLLDKLKKGKIIGKDNCAIINPYFKFKKTSFIIGRLFECGLLEYIEKTMSPSCIILFGSARKGEYDSESDIDLFVESTKDTKLDLRAYEKKLKHKIQLFVHKSIDELQPNLLNNVINGIKLSGYLKVK